MIRLKRNIVAFLVVYLLIGLGTIGSTGWAAEYNGKVDINTASVEQLTTVSGIGPAIAQRIVDYRETNGNFSSTDEIVNVRGIGPKTFEKIKNYLTVSG